MRPFDLSSYLHKEIHRHSQDTESWPAGAFDYQLTVYLGDADLTDQLCGWLSENCSENFIVSKSKSMIIAGGCSDNKLAWEQRHHKSNYDPDVKLTIRLHEQDVLMFRLAWLNPAVDSNGY
jgi:hypothetical protein